MGRNVKEKPEFLYQQELRDQRRKSKKAPPAAPAKKEPAVTGFRTLKVVISDRSPENLQLCYKRLDFPLVHNYFKKFRYHDARQSAVMRGEVTFVDVPGTLYVGLLSHLTAEGRGWTQGKLASDDNE